MKARIQQIKRNWETHIALMALGFAIGVNIKTAIIIIMIGSALFGGWVLYDSYIKPNN